MRLARHSFFAFFTLAVVGACSSNDDSALQDEAAQSVEEFCTSSVATTCQTLASCCGSGTKFDAFECRRVNLASCLESIGVKDVHAGRVKFDRDAAATCLAPATSCPSAHSETQASREQAIACRNVLTGFSPEGAGCTSDSDCAAVGPNAYPSCFKPPATSGSGVCAKTVFSNDGTCGFFTDKLEYRLCPDDKQCEIPESALPPIDAEGKARFDVRGTCKALAQVGQPCGATEGGGYAECAKGLVCKYTGAAQTVCVQPKTKGQDCTASEDCAIGLYCNPQTYLCDTPSDADKPTGLFCYVAVDVQDGGVDEDGGDSDGGGGSGGGQGCTPMNGSCSSGAECCSGMCQGGKCVIETQCLPDGQSCTSGSQCCAGTCNSGMCNGIGTCVAQYGACTSTSQCCSGFTCNSGMCL